MNRAFSSAILGITCCIAGWLGGSFHTRSSIQAEVVGWNWLDMATIIADPNGVAKTADAVLDSAHGNFVARTRALAGEYGKITDQELRERILQSARKLAATKAIMPTGLTMGGAEIANQIISCIAEGTDAETTSHCASEANGANSGNSH